MGRFQSALVSGDVVCSRTAANLAVHVSAAPQVSSTHIRSDQSSGRGTTAVLKFCTLSGMPSRRRAHVDEWHARGAQRLEVSRLQPNPLAEAIDHAAASAPDERVEETVRGGVEALERVGRSAEERVREVARLRPRHREGADVRDPVRLGDVCDVNALGWSANARMPAKVDGDSMRRSASAQASYASSSSLMNHDLNLPIVSSEKILCSTDTCMSCDDQRCPRNQAAHECRVSAGPDRVRRA